MPGKKKKKQKTKKTISRGSRKRGGPDRVKVDSDKSIAPHFDTQERNQGANTDVEIAKGSMDDSSQTDSRPKN